MLRYLILILLFVNIVFWGWTRGWFGEKPDLREREPQRISNQVRPEILHIAPPNQASRQPTRNNNPPPASTPAAGTPSGAPSSPTAPTAQGNPAWVCLESGPLNSDQSAQLKRLVNPILPQNSWETRVYNQPESWVVYIGPFASEDAALKGKNDLIKSGIDEVEILRNHEQYPLGLMLGFFKEQSNAEKRLAELRSKNITEAKIIPWRLTPVGQLLRVPRATPDQRARLERLVATTDIPPFRRCEQQS